MKISKRLIFLLTLWMLVLITGIATSLMVAQASRNSTINLIHQASYNAPANIPVTVSANGGTFDENDPTDDTYNTYITIGNLTTSSTVLPVNTPIRSGYVFDGWEYSTDGTTYSDYSPSSNMPFTDHLYIRAKWSSLIITITDFTVARQGVELLITDETTSTTLLQVETNSGEVIVVNQNISIISGHQIKVRAYSMYGDVSLAVNNYTVNSSQFYSSLTLTCTFTATENVSVTGYAYGQNAGGGGGAD